MLMQFDPFREFDRLAEQLAAGARTPRPFPMDAYRRGDEFVVSFDLPGMAPGAIDLTVEQNVLTIKAERRFDGQEGDEVIAAERPHGAFTRQLFLGETLDAEALGHDSREQLALPAVERPRPAPWRSRPRSRRPAGVPVSTNLPPSDSDLLLDRWPDVVGLDHGAEALGGRDRLQAGDAGAEVWNTRAGVSVPAAVIISGNIFGSAARRRPPRPGSRNSCLRAPGCPSSARG